MAKAAEINQKRNRLVETVRDRVLAIKRANSDAHITVAGDFNTNDSAVLAVLKEIGLNQIDLKGRVTQGAGLQRGKGHQTDFIFSTAELQGPVDIASRSTEGPDGGAIVDKSNQVSDHNLVTVELNLNP